MKIKFFTSLLVFALFFTSIIETYSQAGFSPRVDSLTNLCTIPVLSKLIRELSGDTATIIGGVPYTILSRHYASPHNPKAAQFIYERFQSFGLQPQYMNYRTDGTNVYAKKIGTKYPNRQYIICAHYDDMPSGSLAPGADDNASGSCCVLEAARICAPLNFEYTIVFLAFDEEELGLIGSKAYVDSAYFRGDTILGALNLEMMTYDSNNDYQINIRSNSPSLQLAYTARNIFGLYQPILIPFYVMNNTSSDHASFWTRNYKAICEIQQRSEPNPYYHTVNDKFQNVSMAYYIGLTKAALAYIMTLAYDYLIDINHTPIVNVPSQVPVIATAVIKSPQAVAKGTNGPRLYYKVNNGSFNFVNYSYNNLDTFKFVIPAQNPGVTVSYYIAAQDSLSRFVATLPSKGKGINPPGTTPPDSLFSYSVVVGVAQNNEPVKFALEQNYPNPFNPVTNISFSTAREANIKIVIYDILGRETAELVNNKFNAGKHSFMFEANGLASGIYYYSMFIDGNKFITKKMTLIK